MELRHIKGIGPAKQKKLEAAGIKSVEALARCDVAKVAKKAGIPEATMREHKERAVALTLMQDVRGIGPATLVALSEAGIRSLKELYEASLDRLAREGQVARARAQEWQQDAKSILDHINKESRTPEGRQRLTQEGVEFAKASAQKAQEATVALLDRLQRDGERALRTYEELREKAPEKARQYREKAEAMLARADEVRSDLLARGVELRDQAQARAQEAQVRVREETEKARAGNEGFLARVTARLRRRG